MWQFKYELLKKNVNHSLLPSTITRILFCCRHNVSPSTAPSYVEDSNPGTLAPESGILPRGHGSSTSCGDVKKYSKLKAFFRRSSVRRVPSGIVVIATTKTFRHHLVRNKLSCSPYHSLPPSLTHTITLTLYLSPSLCHTHNHSISLSISHSLPLSLSHTHSLTLSLSLSHSLALSLSSSIAIYLVRSLSISFLFIWRHLSVFSSFLHPFSSLSVSLSFSSISISLYLSLYLSLSLPLPLSLSLYRARVCACQRGNIRPTYIETYMRHYLKKTPEWMATTANNRSGRSGSSCPTRTELWCESVSAIGNRHSMFCLVNSARIH